MKGTYNSDNMTSVDLKKNLIMFHVLIKFLFKRIK